MSGFRARQVLQLSPRGLKDDTGSSVVELALVLPLLCLLLAGVVDFGRACYASIELASAAAAGAVYGTQNNTDVSGMQKAALLDAADVPTMAATAAYGCECSDGSAASVSCTTEPTSCSAGWVYYVQVSTSLTYKPLLAWPGLPSSLALAGFSRMRAGH